MPRQRSSAAGPGQAGLDGTRTAAGARIIRPAGDNRRNRVRMGTALTGTAFTGTGFTGIGFTGTGFTGTGR